MQDFYRNHEGYTLITLVDENGQSHEYGVSLATGQVRWYAPGASISVLDNHPSTEVRNSGPHTMGHTDAYWTGPEDYTETAA